MTDRFTLPALTIAGLLLIAVPASAADFERAKTLYASASYEDALTELGAVEAAADGRASREEIEQYRALCFMALGKTTDAEMALQRLVTIKPAYKMSEADVSPRLVSMYRDVRRRVLPVMVKELYTRGKANIDAKQYTAAMNDFTQMIVLADDPDIADRAAMNDVKQLAQGFFRLAELEIANGGSRVAAAPAANEPAPGIPAALAGGLPMASSSQSSGGRGTASSPAPAGRTAPAARPTYQPAASSPAADRIYTESDRDVIPPTDLSRTIPEWRPPALLKSATLRGVLDIVISESGTVESAQLSQPISPYYDSNLLNAAKQWRFTPALLEGRPVKYRKTMTIVLRPVQ